MTLKHFLMIGFVAAALVACGDDDSSDFATHPTGESSTVIMGKMTDARDGRTYKTVTIGTQTWMAENLNYAYTDVPFGNKRLTSDSSSWCYDNDVSNCSRYGRLYTWAAAMDSVGTWSTNGKGCGDNKTCSPTYPVRGICPEGWHLPTKAEFETLFTAVGDSSTAGKMLKSTSGWNDKDGKNGNGTDAYGFSALPGGARLDGNFFGEGNAADFWSSTGDDSSYAYVVSLAYYGEYANLGDGSKFFGFSVRCVENSKLTSSSSAITQSSSSSAKSSSSVAYVEPCGTDSVDTCEYGTLTDERDDQKYKTVKIGSQTWMAENLNYAYTDVPYNYEGNTSDSTSWCSLYGNSGSLYGNHALYCYKYYGRLYTWAAAMDSVGTWSANGKGCGDGKACSPTYPVRGVCPEGWHLPTTAEFETLFTAVGGTQDAEKEELWDDVGKVLKSTSGWNIYNYLNVDGNGTIRAVVDVSQIVRDVGNGTDAYGFSALPAGYRSDNGGYGWQVDLAYFWSSTEDDSDYANFMNLDYRYDTARLFDDSKRNGFSVRCVKDVQAE